MITFKPLQFSSNDKNFTLQSDKIIRDSIILTLYELNFIYYEITIQKLLTHATKYKLMKVIIIYYFKCNIAFLN